VFEPELKRHSVSPFRRIGWDRTARPSLSKRRRRPRCPIRAQTLENRGRSQAEVCRGARKFSLLTATFRHSTPRPARTADFSRNEGVPGSSPCVGSLRAADISSYPVWASSSYLPQPLGSRPPVPPGWCSPRGGPSVRGLSLLRALECFPGVV
jgi:hypothetical protein